MHLDDGAVQSNRLDLEANDLFLLKFGEDPIHHAGFGPAIHAHVDGVPVPEPFGQTPPFAALLGYIQNGVEYLQIG